MATDRFIYKLEACVENFDQAQQAERSGAHQVELCSRLDLDGLTPSFQDIHQCIEQLNIPVKVMIRSGSGSFTSSPEVLKIMEQEILAVKDLGVSEVVFGLTTPNNKLDCVAMRRLALIARPMRITIHKAIDTCIDILEEVRALKSIGGIHAILTSGGNPTAIEGREMIIRMMEAAGKDIIIIPAGRITKDNVQQIHDLIGASIYHGRKIVGPLDFDS